MSRSHLDYVAVFGQMIDTVDQIASFIRDIDLNDDRCREFDVLEIESEGKRVGIYYFKTVAHGMSDQIASFKIRNIFDSDIIGVTEVSETVLIR